MIEGLLFLFIALLLIVGINFTCNVFKSIFKKGFKETFKELHYEFIQRD